VDDLAAVPHVGLLDLPGWHACHFENIDRCPRRVDQTHGNHEPLSLAALNRLHSQKALLYLLQG
jgi:hypothetical protein